MKWWKIQCLDCGINCDLLTDLKGRVICRECLERHEFREVKDAIEAIKEAEEELCDERSTVECEENPSGL